MIKIFPELESVEDKLRMRDTKLDEDLQLDSFALITLQVEIEDRFNLQFNPLEDDFVEIFSTIGNLIDFIREKCED